MDQVSAADLNESEVKKASPDKITFLEYFFVLLLILYAGRAITFFDSESLKDNPVGVVLPIVLSLALAIKRKIGIDKEFVILIIGFAVYFLAVSTKYNVIQPTFFLTFFLKFLVVYCTIKALKFKFFTIYEQMLSYLAGIALVFWVGQTILGGDTLFSLFSKFPGLRLITNVTGGGLSAVIYSVQPSSFSFVYFAAIPRNAGFAWEPGSFASFLCLGIFVNLFLNPPNKKNKTRFWLLTAALLTTQSTTGYIIFMVIIMFYILNRDLKKSLILLPFAVIIIIYLSSLPFMKAKILGLINETTTAEQMVIHDIGRLNAGAPQRFASFKIAWVDFKNNPVLGLGYHYEKSWVYLIGSRISAVSGIGNLLAQFGLIGFLLFTFYSLKSSFKFANHFKFKGGILFFIIMALISVSYSIFLLSSVMCFWMFGMYDTKEPEVEEEPKPVSQISQFSAE